ncbi:MAG: hypothetical protein IT382_18015 [Deltaproteobacteria bacterium]|nr:hypothetical protein [Deltaproteobacteria bacterium]
MRTTVEITDEQRSQLLKLAAERGEKGFSSVIREALDAYLRAHRSRAAAVRAALGVRGALDGKDGDLLAEDARKTREHWR